MNNTNLLLLGFCVIGALTGRLTWLVHLVCTTPPICAPIRVMCSGRIDPQFVLKALQGGADGVLIAGCHPGECHYVEGNIKALRRFVLLKRILRQMGIEEERVQLVWASASEGTLLAAAVDPDDRAIESFRPITLAANSAVRSQRLQRTGNGPGSRGGVRWPINPNWQCTGAAACGGCEVSVLNIGDKILKVDEIFDIAFFPCIADFKYGDVENYPDDYIDVCLFNGAIRNSENEELAHLLRKKSKVLVAYGSCSYEGCIPALSNLTTAEATFRAVYLDNPSTDNPDGITPQKTTQVPEGELTNSTFFNTVKSLDQVVPVDYYLPGCPPEPHQIWAVLEVVAAALLEGGRIAPARFYCWGQERCCLRGVSFRKG